MTRAYPILQWCGHCKRLAPVLDEVAAAAVGDISFGKVDCTTDDRLCTTYGVKGFPMLMVIQAPTRWVYNGRRKKDDLLTLVARMQMPAVRPLQSASDLEQAMEGEMGSPVVFMQGRSDIETLRSTGAADASAATEAFAAFDAAAHTLKHTDVFVSAAQPELLRALMGGTELPTLPFVARLERGEEPRLLTEVATAASIEAFVGTQRVPSFSLADDSNFGTLMNVPKGDGFMPLALLLLDPKSTGKAGALTMDASFEGVGGALRTLSREPALRDQFVFAMACGAEFEDYLKEIYFIDRSTLPRLIVLWKGDYFLGFFTTLRSFFVDTPGEAADAASMRAFLERVASGSEGFGEFEGRAGAPARWWRIAKGYVPQLHTLDWLPRGTFVLPPVLFVIYLLFKLMSAPDAEYYERELAELQGRQQATAMAAQESLKSKKGN